MCGRHSTKEGKSTYANLEAPKDRYVVAAPRTLTEEQSPQPVGNENATDCLKSTMQSSGTGPPFHPRLPQPVRKESIPIPHSPDVELYILSDQINSTGDWPVACGGFSDIFLGVWTRPSKSSLLNDAPVQVAIKVLRVMIDSRFDNDRAKRRLNREVYLMHGLKHHNIAELFGLSYHMQNRPGMVMRWYPNGNVNQYLANKPGIDRIEIISDVAEGLKYLHTLPGKPIIHGDLKSSNILIDDDGHAVLVDFGLSYIVEDCYHPSGYTTASITGCGSLRWMAPELIVLLESNDDSATPRPTKASDIWSFGCTVYELMTSKLPYHRCAQDWSILQCVMREEGPAHGDVPLDEKLWILLQKCWQWKPADRPDIESISRCISDRK